VVMWHKQEIGEEKNQVIPRGHDSNSQNPKRQTPTLI
jgi:hypothetical protein